MTRLGCWLGGAALAAGGCLTLGCSADEPEPIEVAVAVPFSGSGLMLDARQAWDLVLDDIERGGGVNGQPLVVHERDTPLSAADDLASIARGFVDLTGEGYRYIISLISGAAVEPMLRAATSHGVLAMSITSEEPASQLADYPALLLRGILPTDRLIAKQAAALQARGKTHVALVGPLRAGVADERQVAMRTAYTACEGCQVSEVTYPSDADLYRYDWRSLGQSVAASNPDVVFLAMTDASALADTVFAIESFGFAGEYHFAYGGYVSSVLPAFTGSGVASRFFSYDLALPPGERLDRFLALYEERYGESFVPEPRLIAFADYLALLALAMTRVGSHDPELVAATMKELASPPGDSYGPLDFAAASAAVRAGADIDFDGLSGPLDFDARGEVLDGFALEYGVNQAGEIAPLP
jgi:branched-chain amino acid transport system substrate-binding protein